MSCFALAAVGKTCAANAVGAACRTAQEPARWRRAATASATLHPSCAPTCDRGCSTLSQRARSRCKREPRKRGGPRPPAAPWPAVRRLAVQSEPAGAGCRRVRRARAAGRRAAPLRAAARRAGRARRVSLLRARGGCERDDLGLWRRGRAARVGRRLRGRRAAVAGRPAGRGAARCRPIPWRNRHCRVTANAQKPVRSPPREALVRCKAPAWPACETNC